MKMSWLRVNKQKPCKICEKPDWCAYLEDESLALCMRIESKNPSKGEMGGWIHKLQDPIIPIKPLTKPKQIQSTIDCARLWKKWNDLTPINKLKSFASDLGVEPLALYSIGCSWASQYNAFAFPMMNSSKDIIGIRLRNDKGEKWAVKGSKAGLFLPTFDSKEIVYIVEGPTDLASMLSMGLFAIARPSCLGCEDHVSSLISKRRIKQAVIVSDNDAPGMRGARKLQDSLKISSALFIPPCKDIREFLNLGGDAQTLQSMIKNLVWTVPS